MSDSNRAQVYAQALLQNVTESVAAQLDAVERGLRGDPGARQALSDPLVEFRDKAARLTGYLPADAYPDVRKFLQYLLSESALDLLGPVAAELHFAASGGQRATEAVITSAIPLTDVEKEKIRQKLTRDVGGDIDYTYLVDPNLIGGMVVRVGDQVIDGSVATRLRQLRESIWNAL